MKKFLLLIFLILLAGLFSAFIYVNSNLTNLNNDNTLSVFTVTKGETLTSVSNRLFSGKFIKNSTIFKYYGIYKNYDNKVKEGKYNLSPSMDVLEIYDILINGAQELITVTIPEGYTLRKIGEILESKGITLKDEFINAAKDKNLLSIYGIPFNTAEGFLFPDTYSFEEDYPAILVTETMIKNFFKNLKRIYPSYQQLTQKQLAEKIILASIVEREYKSRTEVKTISSVFYNRLDKNMKLESCATVMYVLTEELGENHRDRLLFSDLKIESSYNTYLNKGLPPTPISNPGYYSLDASFFPSKSEYIFFVVKDREKGLHSFSNNYEDHEEARLNYISGFESKK